MNPIGVLTIVLKRVPAILSIRGCGDLPYCFPPSITVNFLRRSGGVSVGSAGASARCYGVARQREGSRGCRRIWRGEGWFRPVRCCSTGSGRLDLDLMISRPRDLLLYHPYACARALLLRTNFLHHGCGCLLSFSVRIIPVLRLKRRHSPFVADARALCIAANSVSTRRPF
jgi:hypothetical protein